MIAFCGQALKLLQCARKHGAQTLEVVAPTAHISHCNDQHRKALARWPLGDTWLNNAHIARALKEYAIADRIQVSSEYVRKTFLDRGVPAGKIVRFDLQANPRYVPAPEKKPDDGVFRIAYIGGLTPIKGTPLLLEAFERLSVPRKALYLVGNTGNRAAHRFVQSFTKRCSDIHIVPGDPLPVLQIADVYVHPSFQDGLGLAPLEALACGVPVIVSEDTGMKEFVHQGINGFVVPTGERDALIATLEQFARNPFRVDRKGQQK